MNIKEPENSNYAAVVVSIKSINKLDGCDFVVGTPILGYQAIVNKDIEIGTLGIVFPAESQLSEEYARLNNLFRHGDLNDDNGVSGYIEDNRRVKAMKFRGHRSDCLFMPLESLQWTGINISELNEGDIFDVLNGKEICRKFVRKVAGVPRTERNKAKVFKRVDEKFLPEHYDTENYWRNCHVIKGDRIVTVTQKLHGTSIRIGNTLVKRKLSIREKIAKKIGVKVIETEFDHVYGNKKVIKDINNPNQNHFYSTDIWTDEGKKIDEKVPENFILYGELIGWTPNNAPIQKNYTYRVPVGTCELFIHRVAIVTNQGLLIDLTWDQIKEFCKDHDLKHVPELWRGLHRNFSADKFIDKNFFKDGFKNAVPLADESPCDEGVCIRVDGLTPYVLKAKSPIFLQHETKMLDEEVEDLEETQK